MVRAVARMIVTMQTHAALLGACLLLAGCRSLGATYEPPPAAEAVIPAPAQVEILAGAFAVTARTRILVGSGPDGQWIGQYFADLVRRTRGLTLPVDVQQDPRRAAHAIAFVIDPAAAGRSPEAYSINVLPESVIVSARDRRGLLYGAVTLWQIMGDGAGQVASGSVRAQRIVDAPRFAWRGLMLDSARHYQSPEFIERYHRLDGAAQAQCAALAPRSTTRPGGSRSAGIRG